MPFQTGTALTMIKAKTITCLLLTALIYLPGVCASPQSSSAVSDVASNQQGFRKEFDDVCSRTQDAMTFTVEELMALLRRCDALVPKINQLGETQKKVYSKRLEQCRGLFAYVLDSKRNEKN